MAGPFDRIDFRSMEARVLVASLETKDLQDLVAVGNNELMKRLSGNQYRVGEPEVGRISTAESNLKDEETQPAAPEKETYLNFTERRKVEPPVANARLLSGRIAQLERRLFEKEKAGEQIVALLDGLESIVRKDSHKFEDLDRRVTVLYQIADDLIGDVRDLKEQAQSKRRRK